MLEQALVALAASGGTAVATAAGTDAWTGFRQALARWFGRGSERRETAVLERLDQTGAELASAEPDQRDSIVRAHRAIWSTRIQDLLEDLDEQERAEAAAGLRGLLAALPAATGAVSADRGGLAVGGDLRVQAAGGSVAAAVIRGDVTLGRPSPPDAPQG